MTITESKHLYNVLCSNTLEICRKTHPWGLPNFSIKANLTQYWTQPNQPLATLKVPPNLVVPGLLPASPQTLYLLRNQGKEPYYIQFKKGKADRYTRVFLLAEYFRNSRHWGLSEAKEQLKTLGKSHQAKLHCIWEMSTELVKLVKLHWSVRTDVEITVYC